MAAAAGLRREPQLLIDPFRDLPAGRVFGAFGRYRLRLNIGVLRGGDEGSRERRAAVVRHELAHLQNRDVDVTGIAVAAGRVLIVLVTLPLVVLAVVRNATGMVDILWRVGVLIPLVALVRAAVIRSREHYADVRASVGSIPGPGSAPTPSPPARDPGRPAWSSCSGCTRALSGGPWWSPTQDCCSEWASSRPSPSGSPSASRWCT